MEKKSIYLKITEGDKESELNISEADAPQQISIIQGVFALFDVDIDFQEMVRTYMESGKAYQEFYSQFDTNEIVECNEKEETEDELFVKGIKIRHGKKYYRLRYICPNPECKKVANHYITPETKEVSCYDCKTRMIVEPATEEGFPHSDTYHNYFIAGNFQREEGERI